MIFRNQDGIDPTFVGLHLKEMTEGVRITISPMTSGYLLAAKLLLLPALWIIAPVLAIHQEGWRIVPKLAVACVVIQLLLWLMARWYMRTERAIVKTIREAFNEKGS